MSGWPPEAGSPSLGMDAWPEPAPRLRPADAEAVASASPAQAAAQRCAVAVPLWGPALLSQPAEPQLHKGTSPSPPLHCARRTTPIDWGLSRVPPFFPAFFHGQEMLRRGGGM